MDKRFKQKLLVAVIAGMLMPAAAIATEADLMNRIEAMSRELEALKAQVKANEAKSAQTAEQVKAVSAAAANPDAAALEDLKGQMALLQKKSLGSWLTVGGDYRFRYDYLEGQTKTFTDVNATFANAQNTLQGEFFANPAAASSLNPGWTSAQALTGLMGFAQGMNGVGTYEQANAFLGANAAMAGAMGAFAKTVPAYKPKNTSLYSNRFELDLNAKATQDVSVSARLNMYKVFGSQNDSAVTNAGSAPFFCRPGRRV